MNLVTHYIVNNGKYNISVFITERNQILICVSLIKPPKLYYNKYYIKLVLNLDSITKRYKNTTYLINNDKKDHLKNENKIKAVNVILVKNNIVTIENKIIYLTNSYLIKIL